MARINWKHRALALASVFEDWGCDSCPVVVFVPDPETLELTVPTCRKPDDVVCALYLCAIADGWGTVPTHRR